MCGLSLRRGALGGVVGRAGQQNRRIRRALGYHDDGVQLHAVAHGDHHFALDVILVGGWGGEGLGNVAVGGATEPGGQARSEQTYIYFAAESL